MQPHRSEQPIIPLLIQIQLPAPSEPWIRLTVFVQVRSEVPRPVPIMQVKDVAFSDVEKETDIYATSDFKHRNKFGVLDSWEGKNVGRGM